MKLFLGKEDIETETNQDFFYIKHNTQEEIFKRSNKFVYREIRKVWKL